MATLIKKRRKATTAEPGPEPVEQTTSMEMVSTAEPAEAEAPAPAGMPYSAPTPAPPNMSRSYGTMSGYDEGATYSPPGGADDFQLPSRHIPAEPPPSPEPPAGPAGLLQRVLMYSGETTAQERDRVAAEEFEQAVAPVLEYMRAHNPDASTPEEAARIWAENQGEITPDPAGGSYVYGDAFDADARVYYRLLRRDYEKTPRPSERRSVSHHLHGVFNKLPGTRGW